MNYSVDKELARWSHLEFASNGSMSKWEPVINNFPGVSVGTGAVKHLFL